MHACMLRLEKPEASHSAMDEDDWLPLSAVLVIEVCSVTLDMRHNIRNFTFPDYKYYFAGT